MSFIQQVVFITTIVPSGRGLWNPELQMVFTDFTIDEDNNVRKAACNMNTVYAAEMPRRSYGVAGKTCAGL